MVLLRVVLIVNISVTFILAKPVVMVFTVFFVSDVNVPYMILLWAFINYILC